MDLTAYKKLVQSELWMYDTTELLDSGVTDVFSDFFVIDKSMYCNNCKYYGTHCGTFGWCKREVFPNDDGCAGHIKTPVDFCCNRWESA